MTPSLIVNGDIDGRIRGLVVLLADRLSVRDADLIIEMVDHGEPVVGLEWLTDALSESEQGITTAERTPLEAVALELGSDRAAGAIRATQITLR